MCIKLLSYDEAVQTKVVVMTIYLNTRSCNSCKSDCRCCCSVVSVKTEAILVYIPMDGVSELSRVIVPSVVYHETLVRQKS
jgi:hypothetical protein